MIPNPADGFCAERVHGSSGSAKRRRERRLRSMLRHERQSIAMALAERLHHSANVTDLKHKEEVEQHDAPRGQYTPPPGVRPGILPEPWPQRCDRSRRHFAGEVIDSSALAFLTRAALEERRKEEKKVEMKEKEAQKVKQEELRARERVATRELDTLLLTPFVCRSDQENDRVVELQKLLDRLSRDRFALITAPSKRKKKKEEKDEKGTFLLLLFMTSLMILSSLSSAGAWVLPESTELSDLWEMTFSTAPSILQSFVWRWACQRSTIRGLSGR